MKAVKKEKETERKQNEKTKQKNEKSIFLHSFPCAADGLELLLVRPAAPGLRSALPSSTP